MLTPQHLKNRVISSLTRLVPPSMDTSTGAPYLVKYNLRCFIILLEVLSPCKCAISTEMCIVLEMVQWFFFQGLGEVQYNQYLRLARLREPYNPHILCEISRMLQILH